MFYFCKQVSQSENCGGDTGEEEDEKRREMKYMLPGGRKTAGEVSFIWFHEFPFYRMLHLYLLWGYYFYYIQ